MEQEHIPVLYHEVLEALDPQPGGQYLDGTLGMGGHTWGILTASAPTGQVLALDQDPTAIEVATQRLAPFEGRWLAVRTNFDKMKQVALDQEFAPVEGILLDLGFSSLQMDDERRGLSFHSEAPPDMRLDPEGLTSAEDLINTMSEEDLANLIYRYGEEPKSRRIARAIVRDRPFASARALGETISRAVARRGKERIHPATRTFQALRIAVNDELGVLERVLPDAVSLLKPGGRLAIISFHSLEDRIVKQFFREEATDCICPPQLLFCACGHKATLDRRSATRKPIAPTAEEIARNPRARSAKLRVAERLHDTEESIDDER
jgi:16S rRNA (cytosine1402-N4)-methyltransferase